MGRGVEIGEGTRQEVVRLLKAGCTYRDVAWQINIGISTVALVYLQLSEREQKAVQAVRERRLNRMM
jgi:uncharacterized protein YerC